MRGILTRTKGEDREEGEIEQMMIGTYHTVRGNYTLYCIKGGLIP